MSLSGCSRRRVNTNNECLFLAYNFMHECRLSATNNTCDAVVTENLLETLF
jgi:hypothetical protein